MPGFDHRETIAQPLYLPKPVVEMEASILPGIAANSPLLDYFDALALLQKEEVFDVPPAPVDVQWLKAVFGTQPRIEETDLRDALERRQQSPTVLAFQQRRIG